MTTPWLVVFCGSLFQIFLLVTGGVVAWQVLPAGKNLTFVQRWSQNISLEIVNKLSLPIFIFPFAYFLDIRFGLSWLAPGNEIRWKLFLLALLVIDFVLYWRHRLYHLFLQRFHDTHHSDTGFDTSLTLRFHPIENFLNYIILFGLFFLLGLNVIETAWMIQIFAIQAFISHFFQFNRPGKWQIYLGGILITPFLHQAHHNQERKGCNFGFLFSIWDRIFRTVFTVALVLGIVTTNVANAEQVSEQKMRIEETSKPSPSSPGMSVPSHANNFADQSQNVQLSADAAYRTMPRKNQSNVFVFFAVGGFLFLLVALYLFYKAGKAAGSASPGVKKFFVLGSLFFIAGSVSLFYSAFLKSKIQPEVSFPIEYHSPVT